MSGELPAADAALFYVSGPQGQLGPLPLVQILDYVARGQLPASAHFTYQGAPGWLVLDQTPAVASLLAQARERAAGAARQADDEQDQIFGALIRQSWDYFREHELASVVDEVLIGAVITSTLDNGFCLIDLTSSGEHHFLRFEQLETRARIVFQLRHLTPGLLASKVLGHNASVVIGYGEPVADFGRIWQALKAELKSGYIQSAEPGTITVDADVTAGYIYVQVDMFWRVSDYVKPDLAVDHALLQRHIGATVNALRKYLRGRFA